MLDVYIRLMMLFAYIRSVTGPSTINYHPLSQLNAPIDDTVPVFQREPPVILPVSAAISNALKPKVKAEYDENDDSPQKRKNQVSVQCHIVSRLFDLKKDNKLIIDGGALRIEIESYRKNNKDLKKLVSHTYIDDDDKVHRTYTGRDLLEQFVWNGVCCHVML